MKNASLILYTIMLLCLLSGCERIDDWHTEHAVQVRQCRPLPVPRAAARCFTLGGYAYVIGGRTNTDSHNPTYVNDLWRYDIDQDTWTQLDNPPCQSRVQAVATAVGNTAYYGMGYAGTGPYTAAIYLHDFWAYDGSQWTQLADFPADCTDALVAFTSDTAIYVCLGYNPLFQPEMYCYHITSNTWTQLGNIDHLNPAAGCVGAEAEGRYFAGGGFMEITYQQWAEYYPQTDTWQARHDMPYPGRLFAPTATLLSDIYMPGGMIWASQTLGGGPTNTIYSYNILTDRWTLRGHLPKKTMNNIAFALSGRLFTGLGEDEKGNILGDIYEIIARE